ncbi:MAG: hypothetical protein ACI96M_000417 [Candidatus Azotimanducaceae bacterium]|jgi:hypothetical protein
MNDDSIEFSQDQMDYVEIQRNIRQFNGDWNTNIAWKVGADAPGHEHDLATAMRLQQEDEALDGFLQASVLMEEIGEAIEEFDVKELILIRAMCEMIVRATDENCYHRSLDGSFDGTRSS